MVAGAIESKSTIADAIRNLAISLCIMLPWPAIAIAVCMAWSMLGEPLDAMLMFGGITLLFLLPLGVVATPDWVFAVLIGMAWLATLAIPAWRTFVGKRDYLFFSFALQFVFAMLQAGLGWLMLWARGV